MGSDKKQSIKKVGLQIGGTVGQNDIVGMHIPMPTQPGIGVKVQLDDEFDKEVREIYRKIPDDHPKAAQIRKISEEILNTKEKDYKLQKIGTLVMMGAGIIQIATEISKITKLLGF